MLSRYEKREFFLPFQFQILPNIVSFTPNLVLIVKEYFFLCKEIAFLILTFDLTTTKQGEAKIELEEAIKKKDKINLVLKEFISYNFNYNPQYPKRILLNLVLVQNGLSLVFSF